MFLADNLSPCVICIFMSECDYTDPLNYFCNSSVVAGTGFSGTGNLIIIIQNRYLINERPLVLFLFKNK